MELSTAGQLELATGVTCPRAVRRAAQHAYCRYVAAVFGTKEDKDEESTVEDRAARDVLETEEASMGYGRRPMTGGPCQCAGASGGGRDLPRRAQEGPRTGRASSRGRTHRGRQRGGAQNAHASLALAHRCANDL